MPAIGIQAERCTHCGACVALCTGRVFRQEVERVVVADAAACWLCGHCVAVCPTDAVFHRDYPLEECPPLDPSRLPSADALKEVLRARRSVRVFQDQAVPREVVRELVAVGRWAPSARNAQPVDWLALDDPARIAALSAQTVAILAHTARLLRNPLVRFLLRLTAGAEPVRKGMESVPNFERLAQRHAQGEDPIFFHAPVVLLAHVPRDDYFGREDATYAAYNVMLAAHLRGLGTCPIGYFTGALARSARLRTALGLPSDRRAVIAMTLGYPRYRFHRALPRRRPELVWNT